MFTVYKITNQINGKCYIGSSIRVEERWRQHKNCAFNPNDRQYNYPLYQAFRKYGLDNFSFEIIKDDFDSLEEMEKYEHEAIIYYDSYIHGYNQTLSTDRNTLSKENLSKHVLKVSQKCAKVDKDNNILEVYNSYHDAARKNSFGKSDYASHVRRVCKGEMSDIHGIYFRDLDENGKVIQKPFRHSHSKKPLIRISLDNPQEEYYYNSVSEAADDLTNGERRQITAHLSGSTQYSVVRGYLLRELDIDGNIIENSIKIEDKINEYNRLHPEINGERHTITEWCKIYGISTRTYYDRLKKGYDSIAAITTPKKRGDKK